MWGEDEETRRGIAARLLLGGMIAGLVLVSLANSCGIEPDEGIFLPVASDTLLATVHAAAPGDAGCIRIDAAAPGPGPTRLCEGASISLAGLRLRLRDADTVPELELSGATLDAGMIGAAIDADRILRFPGTGAHHAEILPADRCIGGIRCVRALIDGDRTRLQAGPAAPPAILEPGVVEPLHEGDILWLGLIPLEVHAGGDGIILEAPPSYQRFGGRRDWIRDPTPRWPLEGQGPWPLYGEEAQFAFGHVVPQRIDRQWEEEVQKLIDAGLLCLEPGSPAAGRAPRIAWSAADTRCAEQPVGAEPVREIEVLSDRYRHDEMLLKRIDEANEAFGDGRYEAFPELLHFSFDWGYALPAMSGDGAPGSTDVGVHPWDGADAAMLRRVPTRLLGIWWGTSIRHATGARVSSEDSAEGSEARPSIRVSRGSTSPQLRVLAPVGALRTDDLLLLSGARPEVRIDADPASGLAEPGELLGALCVADTRLSGPDLYQRPPANGAPPSRPVFYGSALPLGALTVSTAAGSSLELRLTRLDPARARTCLRIVRTAGGSWLSSSGAGRWAPLEPGDTLHLRGARLIFRDAGDLAAVTRRDATTLEPRRVYPFEQDAGQLIGRGERHFSGIEASLDTLTVGRDGDVELSIHGDLQRTVHRTLQAVMERDLNGTPRTGRDLGMRRGSAVLLDADTGAVLAAASWPPFDPNRDPGDEAQWTAARGPQANVPDVAANWAFCRDRAAGSTYKLATAIALARAGLLQDDSVAAAGSDCGGGLTLYGWSAAMVLPHYAPSPRPRDRWSHFQCESHHPVIPESGGYGPAFVQAFAQSCNVYFGLSALSLLEAGPQLGGPVNLPPIDVAEPDLGLRSDGPLLFGAPGCGDGGTGRCLGLLWSRSVPIARSLVPGPDPMRPGGGNRLWLTLMDLGHRYYYHDGAGRLLTQQRDEEWAPGLRYPTADRPWLPGLRAGFSFRYPEIAGPAAIGGETAWPGGRPPPESWLDGRLRDIAPSRDLKTVAVSGWGQEVAASALSLAVMAAVPASSDGRLISPWILHRDDAPPPTAPPYLTSGLDLIRSAMRRVVQQPPPGAYAGTGWKAAFSKLQADRRRWLTDRIGGKTGTIQEQVVVLDHSDRAEQLWRMRLYACGVEGVNVQPMSAWDPWFSRLAATLPPRGFAAHVPLCEGLVPGRVPVSPGPHDARVATEWASSFRSLTGHTSTRNSLSSAFVAAVFDPFVPPAAPGGGSSAVLTGKGLALAVISDHHDTAAKEAAAAILSDLALYYQIRGGAQPGPRSDRP